MEYTGRLLLLPSPISEAYHHHIPQPVLNILPDLRYIIAERIRTTRRFIKSAWPKVDIDKIYFIEMDKHTRTVDPRYIDWCKAGYDIGLLSEAGVPCVADPGYQYVQIAHANNVHVLPRVGPSSLLLALMASGFNGQHFEFHGYLPRNKGDLKASLQRIEASVIKSGKTHLFIVTPYGNKQMIDQLVQHLKKETQIAIAADLGSDKEEIIRTSVHQLSVYRGLFTEKRPAIFIIGKG